MREAITNRTAVLLKAAAGVALLWCLDSAAAAAPEVRCLFNDSHFHLTNYVQRGTNMRRYMDEMMGGEICRSTVFGIPLQQTWSYENAA